MNQSAVITIPRCYDSHLHWMATGEVISILDLSAVKSISDLQNLKIQKENYRGDWLIGFGWDENLWIDKTEIHISNLNKIFPNCPVIFIRADGHSIWVNSIALKRAQISESTPKSIQDPKGGRYERDQNGNLTGILIDSARDKIDSNLPPYTRVQIKKFLFEAMNLFNANGFTHIRDMGGNQICWELAREMERSEELKLFVEMNFSIDRIEDFKSTLEFAIQARKEQSNLIRVAGIKFYFDGALGSEGALLSRNYPSGKKGLQLFELGQVEEILRRTWECGLPVAIHTLGDEAVHKIVQLAYELKHRGSEGLLNLEHCEVVRPETIKMMRAIDIRCHLQPSHYLADRNWLKEKLGDLIQYAFPWKNLDENGISYSFGSDSPIVNPVLSLTQEGIEQSGKDGISQPLKSVWSGHSHPDGSWGTDCVTRLYPNNDIRVEFKKN